MRRRRDEELYGAFDEQEDELSLEAILAEYGKGGRQPVLEEPSEGPPSQPEPVPEPEPIPEPEPVQKEERVPGPEYESPAPDRVALKDIMSQTVDAVLQGSKVPEGERAEFFRWLYDLEYDRMGLPRPDLVVLLDMPVELSEQLMRKREQSTGTHADIHERDEDYLKKCRDVALHAAKYYGWRTVSCAKDGAIRGVEDIHEEVYAIVKSCLED